jgi:hypothetical protein
VVPAENAWRQHPLRLAQWRYRPSSIKGKPNKFVVAISFTKHGKVRAQ